MHLEAWKGRCFLVGRKEVNTLRVCIFCVPLCSFSAFMEMIGRDLTKMNASKQFVFLLQACQWE